MHSYTCDECKNPLVEPIYTLIVTYNAKTGTASEGHYHWNCLKAYMNRA